MMNTTGHSDTVTEGIRGRVAAQYLPDQSDPDTLNYLFVYRVIMSNEGEKQAELLRRHWIIRDANNGLNEVRGDGVVGEFPDLGPGESFEYMSSSHIPTTWGTMEGSYTFRRPDGATFEALIGRFFLAPNTEPISNL